MKKSLLVILLALALVLTSAGVCFADVPTFVAGENLPVFTSIPSTYYQFAIFTFTTDFLDDCIDDGGYFPLFNNVFVKVNSRSVFSDGVGYNGTTYVLSGGSYYSGGAVQISSYSDYKLWFRTSSSLNTIQQSAISSSSWSSFSASSYIDPAWVEGDLFYVDAMAVADSTAVEIPAGYALKISSNSPIDIGEFSFSYLNTWNFPSSSGSSTRSNGARMGLYDDSNISNGLSADLGSLIPWTPTNSNLFGRASNYSYSSSNSHSTSDGFSYLVTNPLYGGQYVQSDGSDLHQNVSMYAYFSYSHTDPVTFTLVPLKAVLSYEQGVFTYSNIFDIADGVYPGTVTPGQGTDPGSVDFGDTPQGGGNSDEPPLSENTTIFGLLNTLTNYFTGFFNSAINAIQSLFSTGSTFMQSVVTMFSWLPAELTTIIFSAFVILLVVGVLKLLWR